MNRKKQIKPLKPNQFDKEKMQSGKQRNKINTDFNLKVLEESSIQVYITASLSYEQAILKILK